MERHPQSPEGFQTEPEVGGVDRRRFLAQLVAAGLTVSAAEALLAGATANAAVAAGTTLRLRANNDISNTDPAFWPTHIDEWCALSTMEGLVSFRTGTFNNVNCLAQSLEVAKDGLSVHFKLKQGVEFHGGYGEMTAADVKYSYERIAGLAKPNLHAVYQGDWNALQRVKTEGESRERSSSRRSSRPSAAARCPRGPGWSCPRRRCRSWARSSVRTRSAQARTSSSAGRRSRRSC